MSVREDLIPQLIRLRNGLTVHLTEGGVGTRLKMFDGLGSRTRMHWDVDESVKCLCGCTLRASRPPVSLVLLYRCLAGTRLRRSREQDLVAVRRNESGGTVAYSIESKGERSTERDVGVAA
jgi:hypothetical protein